MLSRVLYEIQKDVYILWFTSLILLVKTICVARHKIIHHTDYLSIFNNYDLLS